MSSHRAAASQETSPRNLDARAEDAGRAGTGRVGVLDADRIAAAADRANAPDADADVGDALLRDRVRGMYAYNATSLAGHAIGALVVEAVFRAAPDGLRLGWGAAFAVVWALRVGLAWRLRGPLPADARRLRRGRDVWVARILAGGALWGWAGWAFFGHGGALEQIALIVVVYTYCVACIPILAPQFGLYLLFVALVELPVIVRVASSPGSPAAPEAALVMLIAMAMTTILGRNHRGTFDALARLQRRNVALVAALRAKTAIAEAARVEAEVANRAKTQFFAAASHDLRQPLHAMGLFAEALRRRVSEPEVAQLVLSINESVDALEGLFSELLDITRIDSGGVEVRPQAFALGPLLRRISLHFQPAAFEKGLALRLRDGHHAVLADPLLVERVLRNLVSNAIRYTGDGSVLVSCRRRGDTVRLQVWDTGPGIAPADRQRIFEEFCQLPAAPGAMPEQRKGLGLGLAIVRRLAALMNAPLVLSSTPGRGSVFTLELPRAAAAPSADAGTSTARPPGPVTLAGRSVAIVEDDPAVLAGLRLLLGDWGARVEAFASLAAARAWATQADARPPDLLIVDHRLDDGATGLDAVGLMRDRFGPALPAIVVTGSLLTAGESEVQALDLHVLLKPVVPNKLRALIAFKLKAV